jgi:UDP-glucose 4-epimerase
MEPSVKYSPSEARRSRQASQVRSKPSVLYSPSEARRSRQASQVRSNLLVTGGLGFIGSHTVVCLLERGYHVIIIDNLCNSSLEVIERINAVCSSFSLVGTFCLRQIDLAHDIEGLHRLFKEFQIDAVIHFAGLKSVSESIADPLLYYNNNVTGTLNLLSAMDKSGCRDLIFSSSATVYGADSKEQVSEKMEIGRGITNPYGRTKFMIEQILNDVRSSNPAWRIIALRYFNPIGAHPSGLLGENLDAKASKFSERERTLDLANEVSVDFRSRKSNVSANLMPHLLKSLETGIPLNIFGNDYATPDGTCIRDYIHVVDLAMGHLYALDQLKHVTSYTVYNLGTGRGSSVLELVKTFEEVNGVSIATKFVGRRAGDLPVVVACNDKAVTELGWHPQFGLNEMCRDAYHFYRKNSEQR